MFKTHLVEGGVKLAGLNGFDGSNGLHAASSPQAVPDHALGCIHLDLAGVVEHLAQGLDFCNVPHQRACGMGIDVVDLNFKNFVKSSSVGITAAGPGAACQDNSEQLCRLSCWVVSPACWLLLACLIIQEGHGRE